MTTTNPFCSNPFIYDRRKRGEQQSAFPEQYKDQAMIKLRGGGGIFKDYGITVGDDDYTEGKPFQKG